jgi:hypothetical protein
VDTTTVTATISGEFPHDSACPLGGVTLDPVEAGKFFPIEIKKKN